MRCACWSPGKRWHTPVPASTTRDFIEHIGRLCERAQAFGLAIFIDFHQDVWSRNVGRSGRAPAGCSRSWGCDFRTSSIGRRRSACDASNRYDYSSPLARQDQRYR